MSLPPLQSVAEEPWNQRPCPGVVDVFQDVYRVVGDWASSRTRRALNPLAVEALGRDAPHGAKIQAPYDDRPRVAPILDGSAVLEWLTGDNAAVLPAPGRDGGELSDPMKLTGDPMGFLDPEGEPQEARHHRLSYNETRDLLGFLTNVLDELQIREDALASRIDCLHRLARLRDLSLNRQPGTLILPWWHPYELSNTFVGYDPHVVRQLRPNDAPEAANDENTTLWPLPEMAEGHHPPMAGYELTRSLVLYSGQRLVGGGRTVLRSSRQTIAMLNTSPGRSADFGHLSVVWLPDTDAVVPVDLDRDSCDFEILPVPEDERRWMIRMADGGEVEGVELRDLELFADPPRPHRSVHRMEGVLDLSGATGARVDNVRITCSGRTRRCRPPELPDDVVISLHTRMMHADALVRLGVDRPTRGCVLRQCLLDGEAEHAMLRFGSRSNGNLWLQGEFTSGSGSTLVSDQFSVVWWQPGSSGNWLIEPSLEPRTWEARTFLRMEGKAGALVHPRIEAESGDCTRHPRFEPLNDLEPGLPIADALTTAFTFAEIGPTGDRNVIERVALPVTQIEDRGRRSTVIVDNSDRGGSAAVAGSHDNLLGNARLVARPVVREPADGAPRRTVPRWQIHGPEGTRAIARGARGLRFEPGEDPVVLEQAVRVWGIGTEGGQDPLAFAQRDLEDQRMCLLRKETHFSSGRDGQRSFVAACLLAVDPCGRVKLRLQTRGTGPVIAREVEVVNHEPVRVEREVHLALRTRAGHDEIVFAVEGRDAPFVVAAPALVEGPSLPTGPVRPLGSDGGLVTGPLWLPAASQLWSFAAAQPAHLATAPCRLLGMTLHRADGRLLDIDGAATLLHEGPRFIPAELREAARAAGVAGERFARGRLLGGRAYVGLEAGDVLRLEGRLPAGWRVTAALAEVL